MISIPGVLQTGDEAFTPLVNSVKGRMRRAGPLAQGHYPGSEERSQLAGQRVLLVLWWKITLILQPHSWGLTRSGSRPGVHAGLCVQELNLSLVYEAFRSLASATETGGAKTS